MRNLKLRRVMCLAWALLSLGMVTGAFAQSGKQASGGQANDPNKVVMKVGSVQVTRGAFDSLLSSLPSQQKKQVAKNGRQSVGQNYADMLLLSQAAVRQHLDSTPAFQKQLEQQKDQILAQMEFQELVRHAVVTPSEVSQYYSSHLAQLKQAQVYEVAIIKKAPNSPDGLPETDAQAKASAIRKALSSGEDINKVAAQFNVPNQVTVVPQPQTIPNSPSLPPFAQAAFQMKKGQLSEIEDRPDALIFYQEIGQKTQTLQAATPQIENVLRQQKIKDAVSNLKKQTPIWMDPDYFSPSPASSSGPSLANPAGR